MKYNSNFDAKGQVVYVEPTWVTGETCLLNITNPFEYNTGKIKLTKIRKEFLSELEKENFVITHDKMNKSEDIVSLTMNYLALCGYEIDPITYKKEFDKLIFTAGGEKFNFPTSLTMEQYFKNPFFPAVLKNESLNAGIDKFLIETHDQVEIIKSFYDDFYDNPEYSYAFNNSIFQQLIETPTKYKTYLRVLMAASGDVMGASLKYSKVDEGKREAKGLFEKHFWDEKSKYYLNCQGMFNYYSGGENITFHQPRYSSEKQKILLSHGIDPSNVQVPSEVLEVATNIVTKCNPQLGIICGIDFILNEHDNKWYYLENQAFPAIDEWAAVKGIRVPNVRNINDYVKYNELDLQARYDALMMYMNKKLSNHDTEKENVKTYK